MTNPYVPLLIMAAAAMVLALGGLGASAILGQRARTARRPITTNAESTPRSSTWSAGASLCATTW